MNFLTNVWYLAKFDAFKILRKKELGIMEKSLEMKIVKKDQSIHFPEKIDAHIYFLKKGRIKVVDKENSSENVIHFLEPGNFFGELNAVEESAIKNEAIATKDSLICFIHINTLKELIKHNHQFNLSLHKLIGYKVLKIESRIESLIFKDSRTRITEFLLTIAKNYGQELENSFIVKKFLTINDIARLTASSAVCVNQTLEFLQLQNQLFIDNKNFRIRYQ